MVVLMSHILFSPKRLLDYALGISGQPYVAFSSLRAKLILAFLVVTAPSVGAVAFFAIYARQAALTTEVAAPGGG